MVLCWIYEIEYAVLMSVCALWFTCRSKQPLCIFQQNDKFIVQKSHPPDQRIYKYLCSSNPVVDTREMMAFSLTSKILDWVMRSASDPFDRKYLQTSTTQKAENRFKVNKHFRPRQHKNTQILILWLPCYWYLQKINVLYSSSLQ